MIDGSYCHERHIVRSIEQGKVILSSSSEHGSVWHIDASESHRHRILELAFLQTVILGIFCITIHREKEVGTAEEALLLSPASVLHSTARVATACQVENHGIVSFLLQLMPAMDAVVILHNNLGGTFSKGRYV